MSNDASATTTRAEPASRWVQVISRCFPRVEEKDVPLDLLEAPLESFIGDIGKVVALDSCDKVPNVLFIKTVTKSVLSQIFNLGQGRTTQLKAKKWVEIWVG